MHKHKNYHVRHTRTSHQKHEDRRTHRRTKHQQSPSRQALASFVSIHGYNIGGSHRLEPAPRFVCTLIPSIFIPSCGRLRTSGQKIPIPHGQSCVASSAPGRGLFTSAHRHSADMRKPRLNVSMSSPVYPCRATVVLWRGHEV